MGESRVNGQNKDIYCTWYVFDIYKGRVKAESVFNGLHDRVVKGKRIVNSIAGTLECHEGQ